MIKLKTHEKASCLIAFVCMAMITKAQTDTTGFILKNNKKMKLNAGIITAKLAESRSFYSSVLGFGVTSENEFYLLMHTPGHAAELGFLLPDHPTQQSLFHKAFKGDGIYLAIEVDDVDKLYKEIKKKNINIELPDEPWGDRHFAITDPNGVSIDPVKYQAGNNR